MSAVSVSGVGASAYHQSRTTSSQGAAPTKEEQKSLTEAKEQDSQPTLAEMMEEAKEKAGKREEMFKLPKNSQCYGDAAVIAYSKLARARSAGEVDAASGYARRQIAQLRAAKRSDSDNADRIQAAINQLQKAVNRAGRKKRELSQEKAAAKRKARLEREKRAREARRLDHQLKNRQTMRAYRESGYIQEAVTDNRLQDQLAAARMELREQLREMGASVQTSAETAAQQYTAAASSGTETAPTTEISVEA